MVALAGSQQTYGILLFHLYIPWVHASFFAVSSSIFSLLFILATRLLCMPIPLHHGTIKIRIFT
jgi:hypothetical protein